MRTCIWCEEPISTTDPSDVVETPVVERRQGESVIVVGYLHPECHVRQIVGSIAHQQKRCSCYGGSDEDPPDLSRRNAARQAALFAILQLPVGCD